MSINSVTPGNEIDLSASEWNQMAAVVNHFQDRMGRGLQSPAGFHIDPCRITVKNETGGDLGYGAVVELNGKTLTTLDPFHLWFKGVKPNLTRVAAILNQPLTANSMGPAQLSGVCLARVNVSNTNHRFAAVVNDETDLASSFSGPVLMLEIPAETGLQSIAVALINGSTEIHRGVAAEQINKDESGTVLRANPGTFDLTEQEDEVHSELAPIPEGNVVYYFRQGQTFYAINSEKVQQTILRDIRHQTNDPSIEVQQRSIYVDATDDNTTWVDKIDVESC